MDLEGVMLSGINQTGKVSAMWFKNQNQPNNLQKKKKNQKNKQTKCHKYREQTGDYQKGNWVEGGQNR